MRLDAYCGSLDDPMLGPEEAAEQLARRLAVDARRVGSRQRCRNVIELHSKGEHIAWLGSDIGNHRTYFQATGRWTPALTGELRGQFSGHSVARVDVCADFQAPNAFSTLLALAKESKDPRVKSRNVAPDDPLDGRSWVAGTRGARGYVRLYEKGKQREAKHWNLPDWARFEIEYRPQYSLEKRMAASLETMQLVGQVSWCRKMAEALLATRIERITPPAALKRQLSAHISLTYRKFFEQQLRFGRDWAAIGALFESHWIEADRLRGDRQPPPRRNG